jgi:hypothetical protein
MLQQGGVVNGTGTATQQVFAFGTTYDLGAGLALYGELWHARNKGAGAASSTSNNEGTGLITGVRVKF